MFSDDYLMEKLVLKGGNALDIVYKIADRASIDLDFSIERQFPKGELSNIKSRIDRSLISTFRLEGYEAFDIKFNEKPKRQKKEMSDFWGGYLIEFKVIESSNFPKYSERLDLLRRNATVIGFNQKKTFRIEISKHEYCKEKNDLELDNYTIYVYTPA